MHAWGSMKRHGAALLTWVALAGAALAPAAASAADAGSRFLAPGFTQMVASGKVLLMPVDVELFSLSAGGVSEPKADWTAAARQHMAAAVEEKRKAFGMEASTLSELEADEFAEQVGLHAAVAGSLALHHSVGGVWALPTKDGKLAWSFGDAMAPLAAKTGARYALFMWVRDSYASAERKAMMVGMALLGVAMTGGIQVGYASLVDLQTGDVVWFNRLARTTGDLREIAPARESVGQLLASFPARP